jgi:uncharacterized membrane protein YdjX (TVP38/TMEM64 family)
MNQNIRSEAIMLPVRWQGVEMRTTSTSRLLAFLMFVLLNFTTTNAFSPNFLEYSRTCDPWKKTTRQHSSLLALPTDMLSLVPDAPSFVTQLLSNFDVDTHPIATVLGSYLLVTASDMVPFVPCQPLAVALGAKLGVVWAFPITAAGQTTAGLLAFSAARRAADSDLVRDAGDTKLDSETRAKLQEFRKMTSSDEQDDRTILLTLMGLRLAPFFPFSAGNYLLGGTTAVPLSLFAVATLLGCLLSNFVSTTLGAGGAMLLQQGPP